MVLVEFLLLPHVCRAAAAAVDHPARALVGRWTAQPALPPLPSFSDGPFAGNGDLGLTWGGPPERVTQYVCKKDFWTGAL